MVFDAHTQVGYSGSTTLPYNRSTNSIGNKHVKLVPHELPPSNTDTDLRRINWLKAILVPLFKKLFPINSYY